MMRHPQNILFTGPVEACNACVRPLANEFSFGEMERRLVGLTVPLMV
jgi:hypothetical protein